MMKDFLSKLKEGRVLITFLVIPLFLIGRIIVRSYYGFLPFSWEETITLVMIEVASVLLLFFFLDKEEALSGTTISLSVFILFLNDLLGNTIDNAIYNIVISTIVIMVAIFSIVESILTMKRKTYDNVERLIKVMVFTFGLIVSIFFIESVIFDFGSQWIWLSAIPLASLLMTLAFLLESMEIEISDGNEGIIQAILVILSLATITLGIVSTFYQFWFNIIFGYVFWKMFITTIITIIIIIIIISIFRKITKRKREKRERIEVKKREEEAKKKYEIDKAAARERERERERNRIRSIDILRYNFKNIVNEYTPQDVYKAIDFLDISVDFELFYKIFSEFDFTKLITISIGREKIFWNNELENLFGFVLSLILRTKEDKKLLVLSKKIVDLTKKIEKYSSFFGYDRLNSYDSYINLKNESEKILKNLKEI